MIHLFYGADRSAILAQSEALVKKMLLSDTETSYEKFDADTMDVGVIQSLASSTSLFGGTSLVVIDGGSTHEAFADILPVLKVSTHTFILREGPLLKAVLKPFEKHSENIKLFEQKEGKKEVFNIFAFTDAFGERNKKNAWILYEKACALGLVPEELFWKVVWQVKTLLLAEKTSSAQESGLNPYVFQKAKGNLRQWKKGELEKLSEELAVGYHEARRGGEEVGVMLEKRILSL